MVRRLRWVVLGAGAILAMTGRPVNGQGLIPSSAGNRPEVFISLGRSALIEGDSAAGDWPGIGGGVTWPIFRRLSAQVEIHRMLGTEVETFTSTRSRCQAGVCGPSERFQFRSGTSALTVASADLLVYFSERRFQPFVGAGLGVVWHEGTRLCVPFCKDPRADSEDFRTTEQGSSWTGGVRILASRRLTLTPEIRIYSTKHYSVVRPSIAAGFRW